jgi:two-component system, NtrC family, nitrogen regulation sensor histidine kinase NtrY
MTHELVAQRERLLQTERVAAWRELARRLAHELKNPLFPLQITVENMQRARESHPQEFDEVFREGSRTLLAELANLKQIIARFSDFAKMPAPEMQPVNLC